ncbi:WxcM-like domain-containing protein [Chloroflexota bacterium]
MSEQKPHVIELEIYDDDRGFLVPLTNKLLPEDIRRVYVVGNFSKGIIRGWHYHFKEIKMFYIIKGAAKFVAINPEDPDEKYEFVITERAPKVVVIPPKYANGWVSLADDTLLVSMSSRTIDEILGDSDDIRYDAFKWGKDIWGVKAR